MSLFSNALVRRDDGEAALHRRLDQVLASDYTPQEKMNIISMSCLQPKKQRKKLKESSVRRCVNY